jgi:hypothetical protein
MTSLTKSGEISIIESDEVYCGKRQPELLRLKRKDEPKSNQSRWPANP